MTMGDSNRSSSYEQRGYWPSFTYEPIQRLFLDAAPGKHVNLRTGIY